MGNGERKVTPLLEPPCPHIGRRSRAGHEDRTGGRLGCVGRGWGKSVPGTRPPYSAGAAKISPRTQKAAKKHPLLLL